MQKNQIIDLLDKMPDDVNIGDFVAELHFREKLERGLKQIESGDVLSHEQAKQKLTRWLK